MPEFYPLPEKGVSYEVHELGMRDNLKLMVDVYRPRETGKFPILMAITPYEPAYWPEYLRLQEQIGNPNFQKPIGQIRVSDKTPFEGPDPAFWVPNGYVVVVAHILPRLLKEGERFTDAEIQDAYDMVEWAAGQEWSNGNVGLSGVSYLAIIQWHLASKKCPPSLKAIIPWEGSVDDYRDRRFPGGIPETRFSVKWYEKTFGRKFSERELDAFLDPVAQQSLQKINPPLENITVPALICGSWSDQGHHSRGSFEGWRRISSKHKWLYTHGRRKWEQYYSEEAVEYQKKFLDHFLRGIENGWKEKPPVRLEVRLTRDEYLVRYENGFPLPGTRYKRLWLDAERCVMSTSEVDHTSRVEYDSDEGRAVFDKTFDADTELTGYMKLKLWVCATQADDMDLFAAIKKLDAAGDEVFFYGATNWERGCVALGWLRASQRELNDDMSTPYSPYLRHQGERKLKPGKIYPVEIPILPSSTLFRKGETLRLIISGKDVSKNPGYAYDRTVNKGTHVIYTGGEYDSHLLVPIVPQK